MGLMDKIKKVLFDEEEIIVDDEIEEEPKKESKKEKQKETKKENKETILEKKGFIDYHHDEEDEEVEEDIIKEVVVPKEEEETKKSFNFPLDYDDYEPINKTRSSEPFDDFEQEENDSRLSYNYDINEEKKEVKPVHEVKDYHKLIAEEKEPTKKPFKVTPVISPVYGILEKNYTPEKIVEKKDLSMTSDNRPRDFGPVSFNDRPLPMAKKKEESESVLKKDLVELNTTISELIDDTVNSANIKEINIKSEEVNINMTNEEADIPLEEDITIQTENYDDYKEIETSGIENEYIGNNNIEDAFESTSEFDQIKENDSLEKPVDVDELLNDESHEPSDDTIESDLFNLIDSMYKNDQDEVEED